MKTIVSRGSVVSIQTPEQILIEKKKELENQNNSYLCFDNKPFKYSSSNY